MCKITFQVSLGIRIRYSSTWKIQRSTFPARKWCLPDWRSRRSGAILSLILNKRANRCPVPLTFPRACHRSWKSRRMRASARETSRATRGTDISTIIISSPSSHSCSSHELSSRWYSERSQYLNSNELLLYCWYK